MTVATSVRPFSWDRSLAAGAPWAALAHGAPRGPQPGTAEFQQPVARGCSGPLPPPLIPASFLPLFHPPWGPTPHFSIDPDHSVRVGLA
jgi:hypothetical protein